MNARQFYLLGGALLAVLAAAVFFMVRRAPSQYNTLITPKAAAEITELHIAQPDTAEIVLQEKENGWRLTAPFDMPADEQRVITTLNALPYLNVEPELSHNPADYKLFGVDEPSGVKFRAVSAQGTAAEFAAGRRNGALWYILHDGKVHEATGFPFAYLSEPASFWADRTVFAVSSSGITGISVQNTKTVAIEKTGGKWRFAAPQTAELSTATFVGVIAPALAPLANLRAKAILCAGTDCTAPQDEPVCKIELTLPGKYYPVTLMFRKQTDTTCSATNSEIAETVFIVQADSVQNICSLPQTLPTAR